MVQADDATGKRIKSIEQRLCFIMVCSGAEGVAADKADALNILKQIKGGDKQCPAGLWSPRSSEFSGC